MKQIIMTVTENKRIAKNTFLMTLEGDTSSLTAPGQFINIKLNSFFLRRPISVCDYDENALTIIYKVVGGGTELMSGIKSGEKLDILCGLGNGYDIKKSGGRPVLIGGGVGIPPLYNLCKKLVEQGDDVCVILGFNSADEVFFEEEFKNTGARVFITTADGSRGIKGFVTDALKDIEYSYFYTCGPMPMFKAVEAAAKTGGQFSFEERMGCGFGACMGCSCKTKYGNKRICKEGPVLEREEIIW
ncbi:MAG: dihydroorotate dehydrogenase electron transfer subunit [Clostridia bacterium]|nr:dihydroorotate dehydrogenase electron transfer subunit [Clostridia bacterium]